MALVATHTPIPTQLPTRTRAPRLWVPSANTSPAREWEVKLKGKGMLGTTHWSARKVVLEGDTLAIAKKGTTVATIHLGHASVDVAAKGPKKDAYALTLLDLKTKKSYSLSACVWPGPRPGPRNHPQTAGPRPKTTNSSRGPSRAASRSSASPRCRSSK